VGGTGNTGTEPQGQVGAVATGAPVTATPGWADPAKPAATPDPLAALTEPPPALRPYETAGGPSTGLLAAGATAGTTPTTAEPISGILAGAPTGTPTGANPIVSQPDQIFDHTPFPTHSAPEPPTVAAPVVPEPVAPAAPAEVAMRQIWQPAMGNMTASQWLAANPNWETDFNRAEQRADGTWWVPQDPNAPRPAGPQYYQGTGNVTYGGSVGMR